MPKQKGKSRAKQSIPYSRSSKTNEEEATKKSDDVQDDDQFLKCDKCKALVEGLFQCESCLLWYCCTYGHFPIQEIEIISTCKTLHWFCESCEPTILSKLSTNDPIDSLLAKLETTISKSIELATNKLSDTLKDGRNTFKSDSTLSQTLVISLLSPGILPTKIQLVTMLLLNI